MKRWLRIGVWALIGLVLLAVVWQIMQFVFGVVMFLAKVAIAVLIVALVLGGAYYLISNKLGNAGSSDRSERERLLE
jgi:hypothetical protein